MKRLLLFMIILTAPTVNATDPVTATAQLAQLVEMVRQLNQQITYMQNTLNVQEQLKEMQQAEFVQQISSGGQALFDLTTEINETRDLITDIPSFNEQIDALKNDIGGYLDLYENASSSGDAFEALRGYSAALAQLEDQYWTGTDSVDETARKKHLYHFSRLANDMETLKLLEEVQAANRDDLVSDGGANAAEAAVIQATDTNSLLALALAAQNRELAEEANQALIDADTEKAYNAFISVGK